MTYRAFLSALVITCLLLATASLRTHALSGLGEVHAEKGGENEPAVATAGKDQSTGQQESQDDAEQSIARPATKNSLRGYVHFNGRPPERPKLPLLDKDGKPSDCHTMHKDGARREDLIVSQSGAIANVFVYIRKGHQRRKYAPPEQAAVLNQVGCQFRPRVQGVMIGQKFVMKNGDPVLHNIRAISFRNRPFNIAQPANSEDRSKVFSRQEKAITVQCDLHPWMKAYYFVMDHPYFAVTGADGKFNIEALQAGTYTVTAWHEELGEQNAEITLPASQELRFEFKPRPSTLIIPKVTHASPRSASSSCSSDHQTTFRKKVVTG